MFQMVSYGTLAAESMTDIYYPVTSASTNSHQQSFQSGPLTEVPDIHWKINCNICAKTFTTSTDLRRHTKEQHNPQREIFTCPIQGCSATRARQNEFKRHFINNHFIHDTAKLTELLHDVKSYFVPRIPS